MVAKLLERVFEFLNRFYLKNNKKADLLGVTAMKIFINTCYVEIKELLRRKVMETFTKDRNDTDVDKYQL